MELLARVVVESLIAQVQDEIIASLDPDQVIDQRIVVVDIVEIIALKAFQSVFKLVDRIKIVVVEH